MNVDALTHSGLLQHRSESGEYLGLGEKFSDFIIISIQAFTQRDLNRFGATWLLQHGKKVHLVDLSLLVWENTIVDEQSDAVAGVLRPKAWDEIEELLHQYEDNGLLIPYVTAQLAVEPLFKLMNKYAICRLFYDNGRAPHSRSALEILDARLKLLLDPRALVQRLRKQIVSGVVIDYLIWGGKDAEIRHKHHWIKQVRQTLPSHSYDYATWTTATSFSHSEPYIVFLDQAFPDHPHWNKLFRNSPFNHKYYADIERFLRNVSDILGMSVLIALHPRAAQGDSPYKHFLALRDQTASLVKGARMVVAHNSTAISFAVLGRKPMLLVEVDERRKRNVTRNMASILGCQVAHIDGRNLPPPQKALHVDESKYALYESLFIRHPACNGIAVWDRVFGTSPAFARDVESK